MIVINLVNLRIVIALFQTEGNWVQETVRVFTGISAAALVKIFHASRAALIRNGNQPLRFTVISPPNNLAMWHFFIFSSTTKDAQEEFFTAFIRVYIKYIASLNGEA